MSIQRGKRKGKIEKEKPKRKCRDSQLPFCSWLSGRSREKDREGERKRERESKVS